MRGLSPPAELKRYGGLKIVAFRESRSAWGLVPELPLAVRTRPSGSRIAFEW